jgi:hypothetical protein
MAGLNGGEKRFGRWIGSEPARGGWHSGGGEGESWTRAKTGGSFICPMVLIAADRGISRHANVGTFSNGHCGTVTELNVIWIQRLIMKRKERKQCSVPVESMIRKERITYRCLVLPLSPHIIHVSLTIRWIITPAPPGSGRFSLLCY